MFYYILRYLYICCFSYQLKTQIVLYGMGKETSVQVLKKSTSKSEIVIWGRILGYDTFSNHSIYRRLIYINITGVYSLYTIDYVSELL